MLEPAGGSSQGGQVLPDCGVKGPPVFSTPSWHLRALARAWARAGSLCLLHKEWIYFC